MLLITCPRIGQHSLERLKELLDVILVNRQAGIEPQHVDAGPTRLAWDRTLAFMRERLG